MTGMLASVTSLSEAESALSAGADIIDLKQPASGALGALDADIIASITGRLSGLRPVSATIGDLPLEPPSVVNAVTAMAGTGVDYIKIGFFPGGDLAGTLARLAVQTSRLPALIAVLFADTTPDLAVLDALKAAGFRGVMLDTMDKKRGSLTEVMTPLQIERFVRLTKSRSLLCGLAGSLRERDIEKLIRYRPDYLGFRGALCEGRVRTARLSFDAAVKIKRTLDTLTAAMAKPDEATAI